MIKALQDSKTPTNFNVAVILPAYNEAHTIKETIISFNKALPDANIFIINNNSSDETEVIAKNTLVELACDGAVINEKRQGKGNALRRAFLTIEADIYVLADADMTYPADRVHDLIHPIVTGEADMVVGDRHSGGHYAQENKRALHGFGNRLVQVMINKLFNARLTDIMSGYRVFSQQFVKNYPILVEGFQIETDMTLHALDKRFRIVEIPIEYSDRPEGSFSKLNTISDGAKVIFTIAQIFRFYNPLVFFLFVAALFFSAGFIAGIPVFDDWIREQYIHHVPLAILASALEIIALLSLGIGLMLDSIAHHQKIEFELQLLENSTKYNITRQNDSI